MPVSEQDQARLWAISAGLLGGMIRLANERKLTGPQAVATAAAGACCAVFFAPPVNNAIPGHSTELLAGIAFAMGLSGMSLCRAVIRIADKRGESVLEKVGGRFVPGLSDGKDEGNAAADAEPGKTIGSGSPVPASPSVGGEEGEPTTTRSGGAE
jgi:hypothetical protein